MICGWVPVLGAACASHTTFTWQLKIHMIKRIKRIKRFIAPSSVEEDRELIQTRHQSPKLCMLTSRRRSRNAFVWPFAGLSPIWNETVKERHLCKAPSDNKCFQICSMPVLKGSDGLSPLCHSRESRLVESLNSEIMMWWLNTSDIY